MKPPRDVGRINIRTRIALAVILLIGLSLSLVGVTLSRVEHATTQRQLEESLWLVVDEFEKLARAGVDPETGRAFESPARLIEIALQRSTLSNNEGEIGFADGGLRWTTPGVRVQPEKDLELLSHLVPLTQRPDVTLGEFSTSQTDYLYIVAPVNFEATGQNGALVRVVDKRAAMAVVDQLMKIYIVVAFGSMLLVSSLTWVFAGHLLRPIEQLREAAEAISEDDLSARVPVAGADDLTRLSVAMNGMLDRISESVDSQRRLMDDVGHELRTPVTVVRGHLELMDVDDPDDVVATQTLAIDELDRMGGLVTDLLTLAKSDRPDFVQPAWTSLAQLTDSTFEKVRALGEHRWKLSHVADIDVWADPTRITQAWLQLAANADKYSEPGSAIELGSAIIDGEAHLWVRDEGIGIAPEDIELIQTRFGRTNAGRTHAEGVGLGLSIVGSIMKAHQGRLQIASRQGVGSTFALVLPLTPQVSGPHQEEEQS